MSVSSRTEVRLPRRMAWRVMIPRKISTMFIYELEVEVNSMVIRGLRASHLFTAGCLCVAKLSPRSN
jgi:hypothetical protein